MSSPTFLSRIESSFRRFRRAERGTAAIAFALTLVPMIGFVGAAVDYNSLSNVRNHLQSAADAAALAGAGLPPSATDKQRNELAKAIFASNLLEVRGANPSAGQLTRVRDGVYRYEASVAVDTHVMKLLGIHSVPLSVKADAAKGAPQRGPTEFVIAFDITNSMVFTPSEFDRSVDAMQEFVETMFKGAKPNTVIGNILPFSDRVRLAERARSWLASPAPGSWTGCLQVREETVAGRPQSLIDTPPKALPFTHFEPYTANQGGNSYEFNCFGSEATAGEGKPEKLVDALDRMGRGGTGRPDEGMAWAWRMLSPRWRNHWSKGDYPAAYGEARKLAILVTDGRTEAYRYEVLPPSGKPTVYGHNLGSSRGFENLEHVCAQMKAVGIEVAVVQLNGNEYATPHLQRCASPKRHFPIGSLKEFQEAFELLGGAGGSVVRLVE